MKIALTFFALVLDSRCAVATTPYHDRGAASGLVDFQVFLEARYRPMGRNAAAARRPQYWLLWSRRLQQDRALHHLLDVRWDGDSSLDRANTQGHIADRAITTDSSTAVSFSEQRGRRRLTQAVYRKRFLSIPGPETSNSRTSGI